MRNNRNIAITWPATSFSGWGVYALNLTIELLRLGRNPLWLSPPRSLFLNEKYQTILKPIIKRQEELTNIRMKTGFLEFDFPVLHSLRNDFRPSLDEQIALGSKNIGIVFFEDTNFSKEGLKRAEEYDLIITGSTWNKNVLIDNGLKNVVNVFQGVDLSIFNPIPNYCLYPGRFTIFSGGKLEFRKAQDVVISAFKEFYSRHNDGLLIFAWANHWPKTIKSMQASTLVEGLPNVSSSNEINIGPWLEQNGLPKDAFVDLKLQPHLEIVKYLHTSDAAVFPNRCEPGTNLVAMEAMAAGLPVILSSNTGHLDLIGENNCYPLLKQTPVSSTSVLGGIDGWREPDRGEVINYLEEIYSNREKAKLKGKRAHESILKFSWSERIKELTSHVDSLY